MKKQVVYILISVFVILGIILISSVNLDLNHDGVINITDLQILATHFPGKGIYNASYDLNNNGKVDLFDLVAVAKNVNLSYGKTVFGNQSLLVGYTVSSTNTPSGPIPPGWTLVAAQGFDNGSLPSTQFLWGGADKTANTAIESSVAHTGSNAVGGSYHGDGHSVGWELRNGVAQSREVYVSWWEYDESQGRLNDEMFLMRPYLTVNGQLLQEDVIDWWGYNDIGGGQGGNHTGFNAETAKLVLAPQGNRSAGAMETAYHSSNPSGPNWGAWTQWEVHWKANDPGVANGEAEIYENGNLINSFSGNFTNMVDMTNQAIEIGGVYTKLTWWNNIGNFSAPGSCTNYIGDGIDNGGRVKNFSLSCYCTNECPPNGYVPIFKRYFDDIIVLKK